MDRFFIAFFAAALGAAAGTFGVLQWQASRSAPSETTAEAKNGDDLRQEISEIKRLLERPALLAPARAPSAKSPGESAGTSSAPASAVTPLVSLSKADLEAAVEHATEAALERRAEKDKAERAERTAAKKRVSLAEAARELNLSSSQEGDIRRAYEEATERFLKAMAEPDGDPTAIRRELEAVRGDKAKQTALTMKYMPKFLTKIGDLMSIQSERDEKIKKAVGTENFPKYDKYTIDEEDPFGFSGDVSVGVRAGN